MCTIEAGHRVDSHKCVPGKGAATPAHYDLYHNMYLQLEGRKRFLLFPPAQWQQLYPYPLLHPGGRASQVRVLSQLSVVRS